MSIEMHMSEGPKTRPPPEPAKTFYSDPGTQKPSPSHIQRLVGSATTLLSLRFNELSMGGATDMLANFALISVPQDKTDVNCDVVKFIQHILKFTPEDIPERAEGYVLDEAGCESYAKRRWDRADIPHQDNREGERACCHAFQDIVMDLVRQLQSAAEDTRNFPAVLQFLHDNVVEGDFVLYKPDFGYGHPADGYKWDFLGACGGMKKVQLSACPSDRDRIITMDQIQQLQRERNEHVSLNQPIAEPVLGTKRRAAAEPTVLISKKAKLAEAVLAPGHHKCALVNFTDAELRMAKYMNELLSHGIRAYAFGFLIQETRVTLWYADRMGLATSASFDMFLEPELLLLFTAALHFSNLHQLGVIPFVKYPDGVSQSHNNAILDLPRAVSAEGDLIEGQLSFVFGVAANSLRNVAYGAIGCETTIAPITATGYAQTLFGKEKLVAKLSWPSVHHKSEADTIRVIRKTLRGHQVGSNYLKNIVDLKCSLDMSGMEIGLPRAFMDLSEPFEPRLLRTLILKEYLPLESIRSLNDFKTIYKHIFEAHHWVFEVVGMLHQNPSLDNFLFYYDTAGNVVGVLAGWDTASSKEDRANLRDGMDQAERPGDPADLPTNKPKTDEKKADAKTERRPRYRTDTGPFKALDLLSTTKIVHRYRHDLESFFYILCYFCAQFRPVTSENPDAHFSYLPGWDSGNNKQVYTTKSSFLENHGGAFLALFEKADNAYLPLLGEWIRPLHKTMLRQITALSSKLEEHYGLLSHDLKWSSSRLAEESVVKFRRTMEKADRLITYESFGEILFSA